MITINLVPEHLRKKSTPGVLSLMGMDIPREFLLGVGGVFVVILVASHALLLTAQSAQAVKLAALKGQWGKLLPERQRIDAIGVELRDIKKKTTTITDVTSARTSQWSKKLNVIGDAVPKGVWLKRIALDAGILTLEGTTFSKTTNEIAVIGNFVSGIKKESVFTADFTSIEVQSIQRGKRGATEVADFTITARPRQK